MNPHLYLAFVAASVVLILVPGPNVSLLVANSLRYGARRALVTLAGTSSAIALLLVVASLGITSLMVFLARGFEWLRWAGVLYLVYLGVQHWREAGGDAEPRVTAEVSRAGLYWQGFLVSATNPKTLLFYAAFLPQFLDPALPAGPQLAVLSVTFLGLATTLDGCYTLAAGRLRSLLHGRRARWRSRLTGTFLIGAAAALAAAHQHAP